MRCGRWTSDTGDDAMQTDNVKYLLNELGDVLEEVQKTKGPDEVHKVAMSIAKWISGEVLKRPIFEDVQRLKGMFKKFTDYIKDEDVDKDVLDMVNLLESLATIDALEAMPSLEVATVSNRTEFRKSELYEKFRTVQGWPHARQREEGDWCGEDELAPSLQGLAAAETCNEGKYSDTHHPLRPTRGSCYEGGVHDQGGGECEQRPPTGPGLGRRWRDRPGFEIPFGADGH